MSRTPDPGLAEIETLLQERYESATVTLAEIGRAVIAPTVDLALEIERQARELRNSRRVIDENLLRSAAEPAQSPEDQRLLVALMQLSQQAGLIANQFESIAEQLQEVDPHVVDSQRTAEKLAGMAGLAVVQLSAALAAFTTRDLRLAHTLERQDDLLDRLNREVFEATLDEHVSRDQRELALRHVIIARCLERIGDNAVDIAEQAAYVITAELREFTDASEPKPPRP
jgi:phosphate transport system protein